MHADYSRFQGLWVQDLDIFEGCTQAPSAGSAGTHEGRDWLDGLRVGCEGVRIFLRCTHVSLQVCFEWAAEAGGFKIQVLITAMRLGRGPAVCL